LRGEDWGKSGDRKEKSEGGAAGGSKRKEKG